MPRVITIPVSSLSPLQIEAQYFATLVWPLDDRERKRLIDAYYCLIQPKWPPPDDTELRWARKLYRKAERTIVRERLLAAEFAHAWVTNAIARKGDLAGIELRENGEPIGPMTIETLCGWASRIQHELDGRPYHPDNDTPNNFRLRAWANSKPALHLALITHLAGRHAGPEMKEFAAATFSLMFSDPVATQKLFDLAEQLRGVLLKLARRGAFPLEERDTVRLVAS